jgi:DNA repair exonuclease SbcCD ATPase subunit
MEALQVDEVLRRNRELQQEQNVKNRELQQEQNVNLEAMARWAMQFQQWAHDEISRLRQELAETHEGGMDVQQELEHKINEVKQLQQLACSQAEKIEKMGFEIDNKVDMVKTLQRELENKIGLVKELQQLAWNQGQKIEQVQRELDSKNDEIKELEQADHLIVNRLQGAWESGSLAGRAAGRLVHVLAPPICETSQ